MISIAAVAFASSIAVIDSIRIESRWGGLGTPSEATYRIVRHGDHYRRRFTRVSKEAVDRLAAALMEAPVERKAGLIALAAPEWLRARATEPHPDVSVPVCSPEAKSLLAQHLADPREALKALNSYFSSRWTDDYPFISIDVRFHDDRTIHLESHAQQALMLPWKIGRTETWNPEIPRAIVDLLPRDAAARLTDRHLAHEYVEEVANDMRDPLANLEERCLHRQFLTAVEKELQIVRVYHGSPGTFTAYVRRPEFPANLVLTLVIRDAEKRDAQAKLERTLRHINEYVEIVRGYIEQHPEKHFAIWCVDGVSIEKNEHAVRLSEYDPAYGISSHPRIITADGRVTEVDY